MTDNTELQEIINSLENVDSVSQEINQSLDTTKRNKKDIDEFQGSAIEKAAKVKEVEKEDKGAIPDETLAKIYNVMHESLDKKKFFQIAIAMITKNPEVMKADRGERLKAVYDCAMEGIIPDGIRGAIVPRNCKNKDTGKWETKLTVQWMVRGIIERLHSTGDIEFLHTSVVYEEDDFSLATSTKISGGIDLLHKPQWKKRSKECAIGAYAIVKTKKGQTHCEFVPKEKILACRPAHKDKKGKVRFNNFWDGAHWEQMWIKTALHQLDKRTVLNDGIRMHEIIERDNLIECNRSEQTNDEENK